MNNIESLPESISEQRREHPVPFLHSPPAPFTGKALHVDAQIDRRGTYVPFGIIHDSDRAGGLQSACRVPGTVRGPGDEVATCGPLP